MDAREATYAAFRQIYAADTGSGGLNQTGGGTACVRQFVNIDDIEADPRAARPDSSVVVSVVPQFVYAIGEEAFMADVTLLVACQRVHQSQPTTQQTDPISANNRIGSICARLRAQYDGVTLSSQGSTPTRWSFSMCSITSGPITLEPTEGHVRRSMTFRVWGRAT